MDFKILFPSGYIVEDILNDNIDIQVILESGDVFCGTAFTLSNIQFLMLKDTAIYFWAADIIIVRDLHPETIRQTIIQLTTDNHIEIAFSKIGTIENVFPNHSYQTIQDMGAAYEHV